MIWIGKTEFTLTHRGKSRAFVDSVVALLAVIRLALVAADASHAVHAALVGAARAVMHHNLKHIPVRSVDSVLIPPKVKSTLQGFLSD